MARSPKRMASISSVKSIDKNTVKRLLSYLKGYKKRLILVVFCIIISSIASVASSLFLQSLIDDYIGPLLLVSNPDFSGLLTLILTMCVVFLSGIFASLIYARVMAVVSHGTLKTIRDEMFTHMQELPIKYFDTHSNGDIMSHYTNDADTLRQMISQALPQFISSFLTIVTVFFAMLHLSVWLTLITIVFTICCFILAMVIAKKSGGYFVRQQQSIGNLNGFIEEMINGQKVVKVFNHERKCEEEFDVKNVELQGNMSKANALTMLVMPMMGQLGNALYVIIAFVGGAMGIAGIHNISLFGEPIVTMGTIASFLMLSRNFMNPITQISQQLSSIVMAVAGATRIFELLDEPVEEDNGDVTLIKLDKEDWAWKYGEKMIPVMGHIVLDDVDFSYDGEKMVLHNINVYAEPGQKVALVGATGAGKTTITNLINRFYDIDDGKITYDGIPINRIKKRDLRASLGIVLQDVNLFTGTVMENIRYGKLDATDEECIEAAKLVNAHSFISMLPNGYDTVLEGDGSGLSQGQRQLISIARAAVADPPVMILDEATSSIDTRTEAIVQKGMDNLMKERTVFVIAHRLSTVQNSDVIMVMDNGRIIERGNHEKLMEEKGIYYRLYSGTKSNDN